MNQEAVALYDIKMFYDLNSDLEQKKVSYSYLINSVKKTLCVIAKLIVRNKYKQDQYGPVTSSCKHWSLTPRINLLFCKKIYFFCYSINTQTTKKILRNVQI